MTVTDSQPASEAKAQAFLGKVVGDWFVSLVPDRKHHGRPSFRGSSGVPAA